MESLGRVHDGATGGDERRHITRAQHRGSEGAQAISLDPLRYRLWQRLNKSSNSATASPQA